MNRNKIECEACTFLNEPTAEACAACRNRFDGNRRPIPGDRRGHGDQRPLLHQANNMHGGMNNNSIPIHMPTLAEFGIDKKCCGYFGLVVVFVLIIVFACSWGVVDTTNYGLLHNTITGTVYYDKLFTNGRYCIGPQKKFIQFPRNQILIEFSHEEYSGLGPISGRTGGDTNNVNSGGQPLTLAISLNIQFPPSTIPILYKKYGLEYMARIYQYIQIIVSEDMQLHHPTTFWLHRDLVGEQMEQKIADKLLAECGAKVINFQLLDITFMNIYEDTIVNIQLAIQKRTTMEYQLEVVRVLKEIDIMQSQATAIITKINAEAQAKSAIIMNTAKNRAFNITQQQKTLSYGQFATSLEMMNSTSKVQMLKYIKTRNLRAHKSQTTVMGLDYPFSKQ